MASPEDPMNVDELAEVERIDEQIDQQRASASSRQHARPEARMVQHLDEFYRPQTDAFDARLDRVWQRLEQRGAVARPRPQRQSAAQDWYSMPPTQPPPGQRVPREQRRWSARVAALVAAVVLVALVGGLALGLVLVRHPDNGVASTPTSQASPGSTQTVLSTPPTWTPIIGPVTSPVAAPGGFPLTSIHMIDATTGWAEGPVVKPWRLLRTTDGGTRWQDVTPSSFPTLQHGFQAFFLNASVAWIVSNENDTALQFFRTTNGGQTWLQGGMIPLQNSHVEQFSFVNAQDGWFLGDSSGGTSATSEPVWVYRTTNGGLSWIKISGPISTQAAPNPLPVDGGKTGLTFVNASTGWATGGSHSNTTIWFYVTHDGGYNWQAQPLALPLGVTSTSLFRSLPPTFFSAQDGVLPVIVDNSLDVYVTHDGGASWLARTPLDFPQGLSLGDIRIEFINANEGWAADGSTLFATTDGGQHWTQLPTIPNVSMITTLNFVSQMTGWMICSLTSGELVTVKTVDGGQTWTAIAPTVA